MISHLCGPAAAWARLDVSDPTRARLQLSAINTKLAIIAPSGERVVELYSTRREPLSGDAPQSAADVSRAIVQGDRRIWGEDKDCVELNLEPGLWVLAATPVGDETSTSRFELWGDALPSSELLMAGDYPRLGVIKRRRAPIETQHQLRSRAQRQLSSH